MLKLRFKSLADANVRNPQEFKVLTQLAVFYG